MRSLLALTLLMSIQATAQAQTWRWLSPRPQGNDLRDVWGGPAGFVAVGARGTGGSWPAPREAC